MRRILIVAGFLALAFGVLFLLQGLGAVRWPASSFMIDDRVWIARGAFVALLGAILLAAAWLKRPRRD